MRVDCRYDQSAGNRRGGVADVLLYDQAVINNVLLSELMGFEVHAGTRLDCTLIAD